VRIGVRWNGLGTGKTWKKKKKTRLKIISIITAPREKYFNLCPNCIKDFFAILDLQFSICNSRFAMLDLQFLICNVPQVETLKGDTDAI
jgi:hypothetical protein